MHFQYYCPECRTQLIKFKNTQQCSNCLLNYPYENNYAIFKNYNLTYVSKNDEYVQKLFTEIKHLGFKNGVTKYLTTNNKLISQLTNSQFDKSMDAVFHGIGKKYLRCLNIRDEIGNKSEIISKIFEQVYLIEFNDDSIELQKKRFKENNCPNITITKCDLLKLPFPDNFFDLIVCNGILENITKFTKIDNKNEGNKKMIAELKRVINDEGCIIFGVGGNYDLKITWKTILRNFNGILKKNLTKYISILENEKLLVKPIWTFPSYDSPLYSGDFSNIISLKSFFNNFNMLVSSSKRGEYQKRIMESLFLIFKKFNHPFIKIIFQIFSSSFVFCCWKNTDSKSFENWIKKETKCQNILRLSRNEKNSFMLLDLKGEIKQIVHVKRFGNKIPNRIKYFDINSPEIKNISEQIWKTDWLNGRSVNPKNHNEVLLAVDALIKFQIDTKSEIMTKDDAIEETTIIKNKLEYFGYEINQYTKLLKQYEEYLEKNPISISSVHGDFWLTNVIYNSESKNVTIIDWDTYSKKGNPYTDFIWFLYNFIDARSENHKLNFKNYLEGSGEINEMNKIMEQIKNRINSHFGYKLDYILLFKIYLIKWIIREEQLQEKNYPDDINSKNYSISIYQEILKQFF